MNYFEFYKIPLQFYLNESDLKKQYYNLSRTYHPDQHTLAEDHIQEDNLQKSSYNNEAYKVLQDFFLRLKYILSIKGIMQEDTRNESLPQDFLMEMMDINEEVMDLQMEDNATKKESLIAKVQSLEAELFSKIRTILIQFDGNPEGDHDLQSVKAFYLKRQYLLRIQENLNK